MKTVTPVLSEKIKHIAFWLSFLVVIQHSIKIPGLEYNTFPGTQTNLSTVIIYFIDQQLLTIVSPIFFFISGFLFFNNLDMGMIGKKITRRFFSLVIPFLIASLWGVLLVYIADFATKGALVSHGAHYSLPKTLYQLLETILFSKISYQLWFIRDLLVYIALSPLLYFALKYLSAVTIFLISLTWILNLNTFIVTTDNIIFFPLGALLALKGLDINKKTSLKKIMLFASAWVIIMFLKLYLAFSQQGTVYTLMLFHSIGLFLGSYTIWKAFDYIKQVKVLAPYYRFSFFVFLFHLPYMDLIQYGLKHIMLNFSIQDPLMFALTPILTFMSLIYLGAVLSRYFPSFYGILTGNR